MNFSRDMIFEKYLTFLIKTQNKVNIISAVARDFACETIVSRYVEEVAKWSSPRVQIHFMWSTLGPKLHFSSFWESFPYKISCQLERGRTLPQQGQCSPWPWCQVGHCQRYFSDLFRTYSSICHYFFVSQKQRSSTIKVKSFRTDKYQWMVTRFTINECACGTSS